MRAVRRARRVVRVLALGARLARLGRGVDRAKIFATAVLLGARRITGRPGTRRYRLRIRFGRRVRPIVVSDYGELEVMRDILLDEEYAVEGIAPPKLIIDVGANIGLATLWFRDRYPDALVVALEPDPDTFDKLEMNVAGDPQVHLFNTAAGDRAGEQRLVRPAGYSIASSLARGDTDGQSATVRVETLDGVCDELGLARVDLLKLDVEGAEIEVLRGFQRGLRDVAAVRGEAHPELLGERLDEFFSLLGGFSVTRLSETRDAIAFVAQAR